MCLGQVETELESRHWWEPELDCHQNFQVMNSCLYKFHQATVDNINHSNNDWLCCWGRNISQVGKDKIKEYDIFHRTNLESTSHVRCIVHRKITDQMKYITYLIIMQEPAYKQNMWWMHLYWQLIQFQCKNRHNQESHFKSQD